MESNFNTIKTGIFKMGRGEFALSMLSLYGKPWILAASLLSIPLIIASFIHDIRWGIVFLMLLFLVTPLLLFFLYLFYGLLPVSVMNVMPHSINICCDCIQAEIFRESIDDKTGEIVMNPLSSLKVPYSSIGKFNVGLSSVVFPLQNRSKGFIWIPSSIFDDSHDFSMAIAEIATKIRKNNEN